MPDIDDENRTAIMGWLRCDELVAEGVRRWLVDTLRLPPGESVDDPRISYAQVTRGQVVRSAVERLTGLADPAGSSSAELLDQVAATEQALRSAHGLDYAAAKEGDLGRAVEAQRQLLAAHGKAAVAWAGLASLGAEVWHVVAALHRAQHHRDAVRRAELALYKLEKR